MIKEVELYTVSQSDGAGYSSQIVGYFSTKKMAANYVKCHDSSWFSVDSCTKKALVVEEFGRENVYIIGSIIGLDQVETAEEKEKKAALAKLTEKEKKLLGLI
jgi:hypothetical protein